MTCGEHGLGRGSKDDDPEFGQETQVQYNALELFDYGNVRPLSPSLSPSPRSPSPAPLSLQRIVEDDVFGGGNAPVGAMYRGQGRPLGGRAIQSTVGGDATVVVVVGGYRGKHGRSGFTGTSCDFLLRMQSGVFGRNDCTRTVGPHSRKKSCVDAGSTRE